MPVVAAGVREPRTIAAERGRRDGRADRGITLEPGVRDAVPEVISAVGPRRHEHRGPRRVELDHVDRPYLCRLRLLLDGGGGAAVGGWRAVASECEVVITAWGVALGNGKVKIGMAILETWIKQNQDEDGHAKISSRIVVPRSSFVQHINPAPPLDTRNTPARAVGKGGDGPGLGLEGGVGGAQEDTRVPQVDQVQVLGGGADDEQGRRGVHGVHALAARDGGNGVALS